MEGLDIPVLPRAPWSHRNWGGALSRQPASESLANEFRAVVASDACRRPATTNHSGKDPTHIRSRYRLGCVQHQALSSRFVHQRQPLERTTAGGPIMDEVAGPDVILELGRLLDTAITAASRLRTQFPRFSQPQGPPQPQFVPEPTHPFEVD